ncbi:nucleotidyltransferase domain-containing protein [Cognataquiflexum rubidum]|uniref:nucleotidyltransferase domain-containing protein n=1 Tax=Cognataquiflexum rubidum TaxID=2922273 RepID=UPI001F12D28D|nr:nucleotidyltransferase domain-containing protein [Cognataquiflexum rubidum]MCH6232663.1 nucleotidyltransferase domain-containing protein [Cognataquiflexum rubidum]
MDRKEIINIVKEFALKVLETHCDARFFLFGSFAKGSQTGESDIDIAVVLSDFPNTREKQVELMKIRRAIDSRIEPHPFREKEFVESNPLANEVLKFGLEIKFDLVS